MFYVYGAIGSVFRLGKIFSSFLLSDTVSTAPIQTVRTFLVCLNSIKFVFNRISSKRLVVRRRPSEAPLAANRAQDEIDLTS